MVHGSQEEAEGHKVKNKEDAEICSGHLVGSPQQPYREAVELCGCLGKLKECMGASAPPGPSHPQEEAHSGTGLGGGEC